MYVVFFLMEDVFLSRRDNEYNKNIIVLCIFIYLPYNIYNN